MIGSTVFTSALLSSLALQAQPPKAETPYRNMAPLDQYLIADRNAEIAMARSAAPKAISDDADVMVLERQGYKTAIQGTNGFVCAVLRSWTAGFDDPELWNPKLRAPMCLNTAGARSYLPIIIARTNLALAGKSKTEMVDAMKVAFDQKRLPHMEPGAMGYMLSKDGYLSDLGGHWHPHLMLFVPLADAKSWGAGLSGSPVFAFEDAPERLTVFLVPVVKWSDGTADSHP
jgi:hypothetical protein